MARASLDLFRVGYRWSFSGVTGVGFCTLGALARCDLGDVGGVIVVGAITLGDAGRILGAGTGMGSDGGAIVGCTLGSLVGVSIVVLKMSARSLSAFIFSSPRWG